ncbi:MAG: hypothetical protein IJM32_08250 [Ruminococcus sp.]|nr:hypothetical protein [Ruminococcus sp.]
MNKELFYNACEKIIGKDRSNKGIGTLGEKTLHAVLKNYYEPFEQNHEIKVGRFVADIVGEQGVIEIQTRSFGNLLEKLDNFLEFCEVTVVYPLPALKYVSWLDMETGELSPKHKSPKKCRIYDAFKEIIRIKYALDNPRFHLVLCFLEVDEIRFLNGWSENKKRGSSRCDRIPKDIIEEVRFDCIEDYRRFLPDGLPEEFTSAHYAKACKINKQLASNGLNILSYLGLVERVGKKGRSFIYKVVKQ